jgi:hypothetical protein
LPANIIHRTAAKIAERALGEDTKENRAIVYRWASQTPPEERVFPIYKDGRTIYAKEAEIAAALG